MMLVLSSSEPLEPDTKRATYAQGIGAKSFKITSVKKLMIIGCMGDTAESYPTIKKMMGEVGVTGVFVGHCMDIKITLIIIGRQKGNPSMAALWGMAQAPGLASTSASSRPLVMQGNGMRSLMQMDVHGPEHSTTATLSTGPS